MENKQNSPFSQWEPDSILAYAYDRFRLYWMATNNFPLTLLVELAESWAEVLIADNLRPEDYPLLRSLEDAGVNQPGQPYKMWPSMEEFYENEYQSIDLMRSVMDDDHFNDYMAAVHNVKLFRYGEGDADDPRRADYVRYWSTSLGFLHYHGKRDIAERDLPEELRLAYTLLWSDRWGSLCYLVDTPAGYGVALINEYNCQEEDNFNEKMKPYWKAACKDAAIIASHSEFTGAEIIVSEFSGRNDSHELIVVFPANTQASVFKAAAQKLEELAYQSLNECLGKGKTAKAEGDEA